MDTKAPQPMMAGPLPERIEPDAIIEALVELRFEHDELQEVVLGRLLDIPLWGGHTQLRLPTADIPTPIRDADATLRFQPIVELRSPDGQRVTKVGGHVFSYHIIGAYPGWAVFRSEIADAVHAVIERLRPPRLSRVGFRYVNALRPDEHHVGGLADTNIKIAVGQDGLVDSLILQYQRDHGPKHRVVVRVCTSDIVVGNVRPGYSLLCDIDVATFGGVSLEEFGDTMEWIETAHTVEKTEFFAILPESISIKLQKTGGVNG
jgi:uncharacterized protein (TIGR04255 family)